MNATEDPFDLIASIEDLAKSGEKLLNESRANAHRMFDSALQDRLDAWASRFPGRRFDAYRGYGILHIGISPPLDPDELTAWGDLGNVSEETFEKLFGNEAMLVVEAEALVVAHAAFERKLGESDYKEFAPGTIAIDKTPIPPDEAPVDG